METVPRRGYRFIGPTDTLRATTGGSDPVPRTKRSHTWLVSVLVVTCVLLAGVALFVYRRRAGYPPPTYSVCSTRLTFDDGLQIGATWSPDSRYLAYSSDRGGKFDIWVQQMSGGDAVQITKGPGHHWQPDWSPDGRVYRLLPFRGRRRRAVHHSGPGRCRAGAENFAFRLLPALNWSPDSLEVLFQTEQLCIQQPILCGWTRRCGAPRSPGGSGRGPNGSGVGSVASRWEKRFPCGLGTLCRAARLIPEAVDWAQDRGHSSTSRGQSRVDETNGRTARQPRGG